jgi:periplasmic divalent cation tolerance protein
VVTADDLTVVFSTAASREQGLDIGRRLVEEQLAACVNVVPSVRSIFVWQGKLEEADEALLVVKTRRDRLPALEARLRALHSYDVPEVLALPVLVGSEPYVGWVREAMAAVAMAPTAASVAAEGGERSP